MSEKSVLELNIKAKKQPVVIEVPEKPPNNKEVLQLEVGKKYILERIATQQKLGGTPTPMQLSTHLTQGL